MKDDNETASDDATTIQLSRANSADDSDGIRQPLIDLYKHLGARRSSSRCPYAIMLQATGFEGTNENLPPLFKLFLSPYSSRSQKWQEAFCRVDK